MRNSLTFVHNSSKVLANFDVISCLFLVSSSSDSESKEENNSNFTYHLLVPNHYVN